jgi:putative transposase
MSRVKDAESLRNPVSPGEKACLAAGCSAAVKCPLRTMCGRTPLARIINMNEYNDKRRQTMSRKLNLSTEQIIMKLRTVEELESQGATRKESCRKIGVSPVTYARWRKKYGKEPLDEKRAIKELLKEIERLKRVIVDQCVQIQCLKEANKGNF